jgi:hypothetical protein
MNQRVEEEVEQSALEREYLWGFYSYGEIAPVNGGASCELHNQTMTLTLISE